MSKRAIAAVVATGLALSGTAAQAAGTLVAAGDEWLLTNDAYAPTYAAGTTAFVNNIAATFGGSNYLLLTGNAITGGAGGLSSVAAQLTGLGKTVSYSATLPSSLSGYDAVFHIGQYMADTASLSSFVAGGGNLYISLGSGNYAGGAAGEAAHWNPFLASYGLVAGDTWFTCPCFVDATVTSGPPAVTNLLWGYGQTIDPLANSAGVSYVRGSFATGLADVGLIGTSRQLVTAGAGAVPEPATWLMMIVGFMAVGAAMRGRRRTRVSFTLA